MKKYLFIFVFFAMATTAGFAAVMNTYTDITDLGDTDEFLVWNAAATKNVTWSAFKTEITTELAASWQAADADLTTYAGITPSANIQSLLGSADYAAARTNLGLAIGSNVQAYDANLAALSIANLPTPASNSLVGHTSAGAFANYTAVDLALTTGKFWQGVDSKAAEVSISERIGATFVGTGAGGVIEANQTVFISVPYAVTSIDSWTVICDQDSGATGIIITPYSDAYVEDDIALTTMCTSGAIPHTTDGAGAGGTSHQAAWDCNITSLAANSVVQFKVTTAPTAATSCSITLKVTR